MNRQAKPISALQLLEQVEHAGLDRHVERGRRLVGDQQSRLERQGAGDADALALPARQLVRVAVAQITRQVHAIEQVLDALAQLGTLGDLLQQERLADRLADRQSRVERRTGVLEHEADVATDLAQTVLGDPDHVRAEHRRLALDERQQPDDRPSDRRLARARLADETDHLAGRDRQVTSLTARNAGARPRFGYSMETLAEVDEQVRSSGATASTRRSGSRSASNSFDTSVPRCGTARSSSCVYSSCVARRRPDATGPISTMRPRCITITRSDRSATTPMSCVISRMPASMRSRRSRSNLRISACTVTSSAVVGSSAMSMRGSIARAWAIIARCR